MKKLLSVFSWKYILFMSIFLIVCLEIFGRVYLSYILKKSANQKFQFDSYRIYSHIPNFREGDGKRNWIVINNQGFRRNSDVSFTKPSDTYRIFLMGGSAAHGITSAAPFPIVPVYMDETIDYYLEEQFKQKYPDKKIEVINAAVTGYEVFQHTFYIVSELLNYNPDLIVFIDGYNDHYNNNPAFDYLGSNRYQFWKPRLQHPSFSGWWDYSLLGLSEYSGFARGLYSWKLIRDASAYHSKSIEPNINYKTTEDLILAHEITAKKGFLRAVENNLLILKANNIKTIVCFQPLLILRDSHVVSNKEKQLSLLINSRDSVKKLLTPYVEKYLTALTSKYQTPFINLNTVFNKIEYTQQQLLIDYCHFSPLGGQVVANSIFPIADSLFCITKKCN